MIYQQYPNAYLLFDDEQGGLALPRPPGRLGGMYAAGRRRQLYHALIEQERGRQWQESILNKEKERRQKDKSLREYRARKVALEQQRQRNIWTVLLAEA